MKPIETPEQMADLIGNTVFTVIQRYPKSSKLHADGTIVWGAGSRELGEAVMAVLATHGYIITPAMRNE